MATHHQTASSKVIESLQKQLTCSICLKQYTNPKILPCFHSFCLDCLRGVQKELTKEGNYSLPCPTCRSPCQLPQQGVDALPPSFTINNLTEVYNLMKKVTGKGHTSCEKCQKNDSDRYCKQCAKFLCRQCLQQHDDWTINHETLGLVEVANAAYQLPQAKPEVVNDCAGHNKPLEILCETCEELVCQLCTVKKHKDHNYDVVNDAYTKHKAIIQQSSLQPLNQQINIMLKAITNLIGRKEEIAEQGKNAKQTTHEAIAQIKELLDKTERDLDDAIDQVVNYKLTLIHYQVVDANKRVARLIECRDHIQFSLAVDTPHQVLSTKAKLMSHTESLLATVKDETFKPIEQADLRLVRNKKKSIEDIPSYVGALKYSITSLSAPSSSTSSRLQTVPTVPPKWSPPGPTDSTRPLTTLPSKRVSFNLNPKLESKPLASPTSLMCAIKTEPSSSSTSTEPIASSRSGSDTGSIPILKRKASHNITDDDGHHKAIPCSDDNLQRKKSCMHD